MVRVPSIEEISDGGSSEDEEWLDDELIPRGATRFRDFRDRLGKAIFSGDWTGEECAGWFAGSFGRVHRSEAERDADLEWYRAKNAKEHELADLHVFLPLTPEQLAEIDRKIEPLKKKALAVKHRREAVESALQWIFLEGTLEAFYISRVDGQKVDIARSEWAVKRRRSDKLNSDEVYLHETGVFHVDDLGERRGFTIHIDTKESKTVLTTYFQGEPKEAASQAVSSPRSGSHRGTAAVGRPSLQTEIESACNELIANEKANLDNRKPNYEPIRQIIRKNRKLASGAYISGLGDEAIRKVIAPILDNALAALNEANTASH